MLYLALKMIKKYAIFGIIFIIFKVKNSIIMNYWDRKLVREQLDQRLVTLKNTPSLFEESGWIRLMREAFGMSTKQLAQRVGLDQSRVSRIENAEMEGDLKLSTLKKMAEGLNMKLVYAFVPKDSLESIVMEQAQKVAEKRMAKISHSMKLEDQELSPNEKERAMQSLVQKILIEDPKDLWDQ
jgi:predicted DNA-binding mobile mystery protein A